MGRSKAGLTLGGRPVLEYLLDQQQWAGPTLLVTAPGREHPPGWERFDREAVDPVEGQGPLRGIMTALENAATPLLIVLTVDMPFLLPEHTRWLVGRLHDTPKCLGLMMQRSILGTMRTEPFPFACRMEAAEIISRRLSAGYGSVRWLRKNPYFRAELADWPSSAWANLNTPEEWSEAERALSR